MIKYIQQQLESKQIRTSELIEQYTGIALVSSTEDLRFKFWSGQIIRSVANGTPPQQHFIESSSIAHWCKSRRWALSTRSKLWRNTTSILK